MSDNVGKYQGVETGHIKLNISHTSTLDEIAEAHRYMESNAGAGKIVVVT